MTMDFRKIELQDKDLFLKYLGDYKFYTYEYSFTTLYLWRHYLNVEFAVNEKFLVIKKRRNKLGSYFMEPLGYKECDLKDIVEELAEIRKKYDMEYLFRDVEESFLNKLINIFGNRIEYKEDENNFDYIYNTEDLATLSGGDLKKRRTKYNVFVKNYDNLHVEHIGNRESDKAIKLQCEELSQKWYDEEIIKNEEIYYELKGSKELLNNNDFLNIKAMAVYLENKLIGFSIGEVINNDYGFVYIEKCNKSYDGIYEYINKAFVQKYFLNTKFINRGEDLGDLGLRQAKIGYRPVKLIRKYIVNLR